MSLYKETEFGRIPDDWDFMSASKFCEKVTDGTHDSPKQQSSGKHLITSKHIRGREIDFAGAYLISFSDYEKINERSKVDQWDVIISMIGEYCGFSYVERDELIDYAVKNVGLFKTGNRNKAFWLHYYIQSAIGKSILENLRSGTSQPYISLGALREFPILVPKKIEEQKSIAAVLSSLDDKIDLLHRQNQTLEAMAETLFRQWFIEEAQEDWHIETIGNLGQVITGKTPSIKNGDYWGTDIEFVTPTDFKNYGKYIDTSDRFLSLLGRRKLQNSVVPKNSIIVTCIGSDMGKIAITKKECITNQQINSLVVNNKNVSIEYIYQYLKSIYPLLRSMALGGTTMPIINKTDFSNIKIPVPKTELLEQFNTITASFNGKILNNTNQIRILETLRDTLLPKLMSGDIRMEISR